MTAGVDVAKSSVLSSPAYRALRAEMKAIYAAAKAPCALCGQRTINYDGPPNEPDSFELDHKISRVRRPDLALEPSNLQPSHVRCNRGKGAGDASPDLGEVSETW